MKRQIRWMFILSLISILVLNSYDIGSLAAMFYYNNYNLNAADMDEYIESIDLKSPEGDWYPLVNKYFDNGFSKYAGEDVDLLILYSYGGFKQGTSTLFDTESPQFNTFYGCYIIKSKEEGYFAFDEQGGFLIERIALVPEYDFKYLVVGDMGLSRDDFFLDYEVVRSTVSDEGVFLEIKLRTNSLYHSYSGFDMNYIQYGIPYKKYDREDFYPIDIYGRMMVERVENNTIIVYYIFTPTRELMDTWIF